MTTRRITTILAALLALLIVAPAGATVGIGDPTWRQAAEPEYDIAAYANPLTQEIWLAGRLPMDSARDARALVAYTDADDIARNLDMIVMAADTVPGIDALDIGPMQMYAGMSSGGDAVAMLTSRGADVYLFLVVVPDIRDLDPEAVVTWTVGVMVDGMATSPGPGYVAVDDAGPIAEGDWA